MSSDNLNGAPPLSSEVEEQVRNDYMSSLSELTFNSKPIINTLTIIAGENPSLATTFVKAIREHFSKTKHKLPALYLVDSICKNHGSDYVCHFLPYLVEMFAEGYKFSASDEVTKNAFLKLLQTWKQVFPEEIVKNIEQCTRSSRRSNREITKEQPTHTYKSERMNQTKTRPGLHSHHQPIHYQTNVSSSHRSEERERKEGFDLSDLPAYARNEPQYLEQRQQIQQRQQHTQRSSARHIEGKSISSNIDDSSKRKKIKRDNNHQLQRIDHHSPSSNPIDLLNQLQSLLEGDKVSASVDAQPQHSYTFQKDAPFIELTTQGLQKKILNPSHYLYDRLELQCQQCGIRFSKSSRTSFDAHLDNHFKQNKKISDKGSHMLCRAWFLPEKDWIASSSSLVIDNTLQDQPSSAFFGEKLPIHTKQMIIQSSKLSNEHTSCRICNEPFKTIFDSTLDDWILCDAILIKNDSESFIVHTCCKETHTGHDDQ